MTVLAALATALILDGPDLRNVRILVTHEAERLDTRTAVELSGGVRAGASRTRSTSQTRQQLLVLSGSKASIQVAEQIPYPEWFWTWGQPYGLWSGGVRWRDVGTSLVVEPVALSGGRVRVRLTPAFSYVLDRERQVTEVQRLATEVVVREGDTIEVGSMPIADRQFFDRFLIGFDRSGTAQRMRITLKASVE